MIRPTKEHLFRIRHSTELGLKNDCCPKETLVRQSSPGLGPVRGRGERFRD